MLERQLVICDVTLWQKQLDKGQSQLAHPRHWREVWYRPGHKEEGGVLAHAWSGDGESGPF